MECKSGHCRFFKRNWCELIDTLWNVNVTDATAINKMETELIDTLWNVNTN